MLIMHLRNLQGHLLKKELKDYLVNLGWETKMNKKNNKQIINAAESNN